jgi:hypothetical protein
MNVKELFDKLPFGRLAGKVPALKPVAARATQIACGLVVLLVVIACSGKKDGGSASSGGDSSGGSSGGGTASASSSKSSSGKEAAETDFIYELNAAGDGVVITGYQKDAKGGDLVIPAKIEGYPVVAIKTKSFGSGEFGEEEFNGYKVGNRDLSHAEVAEKGLRPRLTSVVFPDSITEINYSGGWGIFDRCRALTSITFPKNLKVIPPYIFRGNFQLLTSVRWPETLEIIGERAFAGTGFTELVIPEGVKEIRDGAFRDCKNLKSVTIPESIEIIGTGAFASCSELTTVKIPSHPIEYLTYKYDKWEKEYHDDDIGAFSGNPKLTSIAVRKAIMDTGNPNKF